MHLAVIGSTRGMKAAAAESVLRAFLGGRAFVLVCYPAASGVRETPHDQETLDGARNRARACRRLYPNAFCIGLESGLVERFEQWFEEAWAFVIAPDGREAVGYSSGLRVPDYVLRRMRESGLPHAEVMGLIESERGIPANDTWGNYSGGRIGRVVGLEEALRNAFVLVLAPPASLYSVATGGPPVG
jgi:non-canonical (house-cleaning) NTP pyrophosphatase